MASRPALKLTPRLRLYHACQAPSVTLPSRGHAPGRLRRHGYTSRGLQYFQSPPLSPAAVHPCHELIFTKLTIIFHPFRLLPQYDSCRNRKKKTFVSLRSVCVYAANPPLPRVHSGDRAEQGRFGQINNLHISISKNMSSILPYARTAPQPMSVLRSGHDFRPLPKQ